MMTLNRVLPGLAFMGAFAVVCLVPALAQAQAGSEPSTACRLFPLACPGPTPPIPQPLLGAPEEQAEAPPPVQHAKRRKRAVHKTHAAKPDSQ